MNAAETTDLTLDELSQRVEKMLHDRGLIDLQQDGRVSAAPDARTVRYYTTLGLLDRPGYEGRQARYGPRHVRQLLAIKALQGASLPLAEIQRRLYGRSDAELESIVAAVTQPRPRRAAELHAVAWREVTLEPGLKVLVEESWAPRASAEELSSKFRAVIAALTRKNNEGDPQ